MSYRQLIVTHPQSYSQAPAVFLCGHHDSLILPPNSTDADVTIEREKALVNMCFSCNYYSRIESIRHSLMKHGINVPSLFGSIMAVQLAESIRIEVLTEAMQLLGVDHDEVAANLKNVVRRDAMILLVGMTTHEWIESSRMDKADDDMRIVDINLNFLAQ